MQVLCTYKLAAQDNNKVNKDMQFIFKKISFFQSYYL